MKTADMSVWVMLRSVVLGNRERELTRAALDQRVQELESFPLREVEERLGIADTTPSDVRARAGYSKNKLYRTLSQGDRKARRERVNRFLRDYVRSG